MSKPDNYWEQQAVIRQGIIVSERRKAARLQSQVEELEKEIKRLHRLINGMHVAA